ncbi:helicase associated domain-containing protein [Streptomyces sp. NPDC001544]|uniref:helicase associated domain-containing protein n=1 Tax=Streptomyces sp. NPDC001544 TaxID=3364584 RepID=UPI0036BED609
MLSAWAGHPHRPCSSGCRSRASGSGPRARTRRPRPRRTQASEWATNYSAARQFYEREEHLRVPRKHVERIAVIGRNDEDQEQRDIKLGAWIGNQRSRVAGRGGTGDRVFPADTGALRARVGTGLGSGAAPDPGQRVLAVATDPVPLRRWSGAGGGVRPAGAVAFWWSAAAQEGDFLPGAGDGLCQVGAGGFLLHGAEPVSTACSPP